MSIKYENATWNIIEKFFYDNPQILVKHHIDSYNDFFRTGLKNIIKERNPIVLQKEQDSKSKQFKYRCELYLGGKDGSKIYYGKPVIFDNNREHYMFPNEARLRNMTYGISIHYDLEVEYSIYDDDGELHKSSETFDKLFLGRFPIMLQSDLCILNTLDREVRYNMGECKNDYGGYFIIDGKEKVIISQEKFADNMLYIRDKYNDIYSHGADIRTVSEDASKPERTLSVRIVASTEANKNNQIVVNIPNVRKPIPLFIVFRALGVITDKEIIEYCLLDIEKNDSMVDLFIPSIHDANKIFTQETALEFIKTFTKGYTVNHVMDILMNYFMPNIGELNFQQKAYFLGYIVYNLLLVFMKLEPPTDRDSFNFKRVEVPGMLMYDLFKEYYKMQQDNIKLKMDTEYNLKKSKTIYQNENFKELISKNYEKIFGERVVESGFKKGFKGNWGAAEHTKRLGVVQDLNRLSYNSFISHLRKINLPMDSSAKVVKPRLLHGSQWGIIDPVDTPDGGNVGFHKHMAISTSITSGCSGYPMMNFMRSICKMKLLSECNSKSLYNVTKILINGSWIGVIDNPQEILRVIKKYKRNGLLPIYNSATWNIKKNEIIIFTDSGRLCRPIFYIEDGNVSFKKKQILEKLLNNKFTWTDLISGFSQKKDENYDINRCNIYNIEELYNTDNFDNLDDSKAIIEYIDTSETENILISSKHDFNKHKPYTHVEIHPSLLLGVMGNQIVFPENNQLPRDLFSCGQSKQAVSLYSSNYLNRIDKMGVVLNYGQVPLVKSRYLQFINNEEHPYGENIIVAIMVYGGYNVEDSILFNEGSIKRGMFRTTYYNMYESREESSKIGDSMVDSHFENIHKSNSAGLKSGYDYNYLDDYGLVKENTQMNDKIAVIGKVQTNLSNPNMISNVSTYPKKGQLGFVDKSFMTEDEEGFRLAKIRIREERIPAIGDKFCSRCGQKGTVGLVIPEKDMPFTDDGVRPDIIINPHALPSRMTIGQLVETIMGKACAYTGGFGDCTAFINKGTTNDMFGKILSQNGLNSSGNQLLYDGLTGQQLDAEIFIGPTYYMRLKHMVKDKINYRSRGPIKQLTRQTVGGRANDGGLRIGEMERDGVIAHGATGFLQQSMLYRGDEYYMAVCNKTGNIAIYNSNQNLFISPLADGPIKFKDTLEKKMNIENITKFGRSFSVLKIPYAFKLLMQELQVMNVQMRIITEENIEQFENMSYSNNIIKLKKLKNGGKHDSNAIDFHISNELRTRNTKMRDPHDYGDSPEKENEPIEKPNKEQEQEKPTEPEEYGWNYYSYDEDRGEAYKSIILDSKGHPTEIWFVGEKNGILPNRYPNKWNSKMLNYHDGQPIKPKTMINELLKIQAPNNWTIALNNIKVNNIEYNSPAYLVGTPTSADTPLSDPNSTSPDYPLSHFDQNKHGHLVYETNKDTGYISAKPRYGNEYGNIGYYFMNMNDGDKVKILQFPFDTQVKILNDIVKELEAKYPADDGNERVNYLKKMDINPILRGYKNELVTPQQSPQNQQNQQSQGNSVLVLDSNSPVVIMPNQTNVQTQLPTSEEIPEKEISVDTNDKDDSVEKIESLISKSKPREDGIQLLINSDTEEEKKEEKENEDDGEKKTIKI